MVRAQTRARASSSRRRREPASAATAPVSRRAGGCLQEETSVGHELAVDLGEGEFVTVEKVVGVYTSRDSAISEPGTRPAEPSAERRRFNELLERHALAWHQLWRRFGISIEEGEERTP